MRYLLLFSLFLISSCNSKNMTIVETSNFIGLNISSVNINGPFKVRVVEGTSSGVTLIANEYLEDKTIFSITPSGDLLITLSDENTIEKNTKLELIVSTKILNSISAHRASKISIEPSYSTLSYVNAKNASEIKFLNNLSTDESLKIEASDASSIEFENSLAVNGNLYVVAHGASPVKFSLLSVKKSIDIEAHEASEVFINTGENTNHSDDSKYRATGASKIIADNFKSTSLSVVGESASSVQVDAANNITVKLSGASTLLYKPYDDLKIDIIEVSGASYITKL